MRDVVELQVMKYVLPESRNGRGGGGKPRLNKHGSLLQCEAIATRKETNSFGWERLEEWMESICVQSFWVEPDFERVG